MISTKEAYGYETIADAERAEAEARGEARFQEEKRRVARALLLDGVSIHIIASATGLGEADILSL